MFNENEYREVFSQVTASEDVFRRIINMDKRTSKRRGTGYVTKVLVAAAVICALAVTASASESVASWFRGYFGEKSENGLTAEQGMFIEENEQVINEVQVQDNCAVELKSFITDGQYACLVLRVIAPEGMRIEDASIGNWGGPGLLEPEEPWTMNSKAVFMEVVDDGDGKENTIDIVLEAMAKYDGIEKPFDYGTVWNLHIEDFSANCVNEDYLSQLQMENGMVALSEEEMVNAYNVLTLTEGTWDYQLTIEDGDFREITFDLEEPVETSTVVGKKIQNGKYEDYFEKVSIISVKVRSLGVTLELAENNFTYNESYNVVMRDGTQIAVNPCAYYHSYSCEPIILEEVDHILLADGTIIPVPGIIE